MGREKYLGGALGRDGKIYAIPGHARRVLRIDPSTGVADLVGPSFEGAFKWLRSVTCPVSGAIYGLPCHSDAVLKIEVATGTVSLLGGGLRSGAHRDDGKYKYLGGCLAPATGDAAGPAGDGAGGGKKRRRPKPAEPPPPPPAEKKKKKKKKTGDARPDAKSAVDKAMALLLGDS